MNNAPLNVKPMNAISYRLMAFLIRRMKPRIFVTTLLKQARVTQGKTVLDYACGPGVFSLAAAENVGESGYVYAADIQPLAVAEVNKRAQKEGLTNLSTINTDCNTHLPDGSVDVVLLFDCFHNFKDPRPILSEMHRVLKPAGILAVQIDHFDPARSTLLIEQSGLFIIEERFPAHKHFIFRPVQQ
nr:class I SAM-dependent methyltransferase [Candidatus Sigynarchaeota archaeon]